MTSARDSVYSDGLQVEFYRRQASLCHELATKAQAATPPFSRLRALAKAYEAKAKGVELQPRTPLVKNEWARSSRHNSPSHT